MAMKLAWNSSLQDIHNIEILGFRIIITDGNSYLQEHTVVAGTSLLVVQNLQRNKTYSVGIQARNEVGYGETANITATTLSAGMGLSLKCPEKKRQYTDHASCEVHITA